MALIVIFLIVIVFWMVFHQNQTTLTYWADENTDWNVTGTLSNAINPAWILILTFPLVWFWKKLDEKGMEPSTPTKMAIGMCLTGLSFFVLYFAGKAGGDVGKVSPWWLISAYGVLTLGELMLSPMVYGWVEAQRHQAWILEQCAALFDAKKLHVELSRVLALEDAAEAHRLIEAGGMRGKLVLVIG